jgi:hypothetical protein
MSNKISSSYDEGYVYAVVIGQCCAGRLQYVGIFIQRTDTDRYLKGLLQSQMVNCNHIKIDDKMSSWDNLTNYGIEISE